LDPNLSILRDFGGSRLTTTERENILEMVGNGSMNPLEVLKKILPADRMMKPANIRAGESNNSSSSNSLTVAEVLITGERGHKTQLASCCTPKPPDEIVGYITRGRGVSVHRQNCKLLKGLDNERFIRTAWNLGGGRLYTAKIRIDRRSRIGLLRDIANVFADRNLPVLDIENIRESDSDLGYMIVVAQVDTLETLSDIIQQLEEIEGVFGAREVD
jgi:GTP pyrophosphokinase